MQDEAEQKAKIDREQANEFEYADESQKAENSDSTNGGEKPVRNPEREKPKWEDTITNRTHLLHRHLRQVFQKQRYLLIFIRK